jgi:hypothetical protein
MDSMVTTLNTNSGSSMATTFNRGDQVTHPRRPEWGIGLVDQAVKIEHHGQSAQRLVVSFANQGRVTINTAIAKLVLKGRKTPEVTNAAPPPMPAPRATRDDGGWLGNLAKQNNPRAEQELWVLPESMRDPFVSDSTRLRAILDSFRFNNDPRSLLDWAISQTGLRDPLSKYTRHELEEGYIRFVREREQHLFQLVQQLKKQGGAAILEGLWSELHNRAARQALRKAMQG